uniref:Uncharacterized protein n=1 Tax=Glossina palpalis gambiensis TaxID=67801 RepID=A0A1B0AU94_9MUSC
MSHCATIHHKEELHFANKINKIFPFREVKTPPRLKGNCGTANALVIASSKVKIQQYTCALSLIVNENCADNVVAATGIRNIRDINLLSLELYTPVINKLISMRGQHTLNNWKTYIVDLKRYLL